MTKILAAALLFLTALGVTGTVTLQFTNISHSLLGLSDQTSTVGINGLFWGVVVDSEGDGFAGLMIDPDQEFELSAGAELSPGDYFFPSGLTKNPQPFYAEVGPGSPVATDPPIDPYSIPSIPLNAKFAIIWFPPGIHEGQIVPPGTSYGIIENPALILPGNGGLSNYGNLFAAPDEPYRNTENFAVTAAPSNLSSSIVTVDPGGGDPTTQNLAFQFPVKNINYPALTYTLWKSTDLSNWSVATMTTETLSDDGTTRVLQITDPDPVGSDPTGRRFLRLEITP